MLKPEVNILDMLFQAPMVSDGFPGIAIEGESDVNQPAFNELMLSLLGGMPSGLSAIGSDQVAGLDNQLVSSQTLKEADILNAALINNPDTWTAQTKELAGEAGKGQVVSEKVPQDNSMAELNFINRSQQPVMTEQVEQLAVGRYQINDVSLHGGKVTLTLVGEQNERLIVTLPKESLASADLTNRLHLADQFSNQMALSDLSQRLKLKELVVTEATQTKQGISLTVPADGDDVGQTIVTVAPERMRVLRQTDLKLASNQVLVNETVDKKSSLTATAVESITVDEEVPQEILKQPTLMKPQVLSSRQAGLAQQHQLNMLKYNGEKTNMQQLMPEMMHTQDGSYSIEQLNSGSDIRWIESKTAPIKFTLPDNAQQSLRPNGQSVMLRIEPDNLGPAKLSLSMSNDKLRARLVVNSPLAKEMVEGSLHKLVDQLEKVNIKVDLVDVHVADEQTGQELFERQAYRPRKMNNRNLIEEINDKTDVEPVSPVASHVNTQYVGAGGVNMLA